MDSQTVGNKGKSLFNKLPFINQFKQNRKMLLLIIGVVIVAISSIAYLWLKDDDYGVLFSNLNDKDGGEIISQLDKMNIPYQFSSSGSTILIPEDKIYQTRLRIAQQGLPKGGAVGFELLDKESFGMSQFNEQINYQRALEGELSRTISIISSVDDARVHLAMPKPSLFVRERKFPSASVALTLLPGRSLSQGQIDAIIHLISSSVPELQADKVTIIDQRGHLLTGEKYRDSNVNVAQLEFSERIETGIRERVEKIIIPILGKSNVMVQVNAEVDFSRQESTSETFDPNSDMANQTVRSKQQVENRQLAANSGIGGVPGALSNQPVPNSSAPIDEQSDKEDKNNKQQNYNLQTNNTLNFEVNRQVVHSKIPEGRIKRLSVAVLVNYKFVNTEQIEKTDDKQDDSAKEATEQWVKLDKDELANIEALARQAMGFSDLRGDSLTVANLKFTDQVDDDNQTFAFLNSSEFYDLLKMGIKYLIYILIAWFAWKKMLRSLWIKLQRQLLHSTNQSSDASSSGEEKLDYKAHSKQQQKIFEDNMQQQQYIRKIVEKDPRVMALIIRGWLNNEGSE
ncbi:MULTISPECIES: flagellar basal-body MS-ring/collar protein FliF [unclassified Gilliamella]|uniref:flagellar basal-body MS-ring/collar protein FliF n=1 Tax=unclassified Gilliamella TaxID=2685620 RepID=UPI00226A892C|nr:MULTISPECIES: flagellar basal-body MS-ring/collar protein FliF [unclassified Gilliamella]MCX8601752.1 flagellar M-ring protein FliF [Gilliamella sp. B3722]MCX8608410.1 flagellar M-ring protein FliF [Gilliamella sp. B3771]MCX8611015.1 flagellar M-ring protein FliF [Gilliamella sp. B3891]MCX8613483.1 flagellar M-ring protein FliF [Gilliamella sp. B3773]MCX8616397.1 flagellar M-ring protein FliF [Gilliamella sp. B3770]